jgi:hypothetical protein
LLGAQSAAAVADSGAPHGAYPRARREPDIKPSNTFPQVCGGAGSLGACAGRELRETGEPAAMPRRPTPGPAPAAGGRPRRRPQRPAARAGRAPSSAVTITAHALAWRWAWEDQSRSRPARGGGSKGGVGGRATQCHQPPREQSDGRAHPLGTRGAFLAILPKRFQRGKPLVDLPGRGRTAAARPAAELQEGRT